MGFRAVANLGGSKSFIHRYRPKDIGSNAVIEKKIITIGNCYDNSEVRNSDKISKTYNYYFFFIKEKSFEDNLMRSLNSKGYYICQEGEIDFNKLSLIIKQSRQNIFH